MDLSTVHFINMAGQRKMKTDVLYLHAENIQSILGENRLEGIHDLFDCDNKLNLFDLNKMTDKEIKKLEPDYTFIQSRHSDCMFGWLQTFKVNKKIESNIKTLPELLDFISKHEKTARLLIP